MKFLGVMMSNQINSAAISDLWILFVKTCKFAKASFKVTTIKFPEYVQPLKIPIASIGILESVQVVQTLGKLPKQMTRVFQAVIGQQWGEAVKETVEIAALSAEFTDSVETTWCSLETFGYMAVPEILRKIVIPLAPMMVVHGSIKTGIDTYRVFQEMQVNKAALINYNPMEYIDSANRLYPGKKNQKKREIMISYASKLENPTNRQVIIDAIQRNLFRKIVLNTIGVTANVGYKLVTTAAIFTPVSPAVVAGVGFARAGIALGKVAANYFQWGVAKVPD